VGKVMTEPPLFAAKATLVFNPNDTVVAESNRRNEYGRGDDQRFFNSRVMLLLNDDVIKKVVAVLQPTHVMAQEENPDEKTYTGARKFASDMKRRLGEMIESLNKGGQEIEIPQKAASDQRATQSFKNRCKVTPDPTTYTVELRIVGANPKLLEEELDLWIGSYTKHILQMTKQNQTLFVDDRTQLYSKLEQEARRAVEAFKKDNTEITKTNEELVNQEITTLQLAKLEIRRRMDLGEDSQIPVMLPPGVERDPEMESLKGQIRAQEDAILQLIPLWGENSDLVKVQNERLRLLKERLKSDVEPGDVPEGDRKAHLQSQFDKVSASLSEAMTRYMALKLKMEKLDALQERLNRIEQTLKSYEDENRVQADRLELSKYVQVQIAERPQVNWTPYNSKRHQLVLAAAGVGLGAGLVLAILLEVLRGTVRFKNDVVTEFNLPVVAVISRK
jgi:uncharacterized protein involved in exopolysaccharide biosynthesis